jgi:hypothetical protein
MRSKPVVWLVVGLLTTAALPMGAAVDRTTMTVEPGEETVLTSPLTVDRLLVEGTLTAADSQPLVVHANEIRVEADGEIRTEHATRGASAAGVQAVASPGTDAASIVLDATSITVAEDGLVMAGSGAAGGVAQSTFAAEGGDGGDGGDVIVTAQQTTLEGRILPGAGGDGGSATVAREGPAPDVADAKGPGWAIGGDAGDSGVFTLNGQVQTLESVDRPAPTVTSRSCVGGYVGCDYQIAGPAAPGAGGGTSFDCSNPYGEDGDPNPTGNGGDGGDGCSSSTGGDGDPGEDGEDGTFDCTDGGPGGPGGQGQASATSGGQGGTGLMSGGDGGAATTKAVGGDGGPGGEGGTSSIGGDCRGGDGGKGGDASAPSATAGNGGNGICGDGGNGGDATSTANAGKGGQGGRGDPAGNNGENGQPAQGAATPGSGGQGLGVCPGEIADIDA